MHRTPPPEKRPAPDSDKKAPEPPTPESEAILDEELDESFPASDPRPWTHRDE